MKCKATVYTDSGYVWHCPRPVLVGGYCAHHIPKHPYRIKFTWPEGKVRWCAGQSVTKDIEQAVLYTYAEACDIVANKYHDARLVWGIVTTKVAVP